jgi:hypothetical protein
MKTIFPLSFFGVIHFFLTYFLFILSDMLLIKEIKLSIHHCFFVQIFIDSFILVNGIIDFCITN